MLNLENIIMNFGWFNYGERIVALKPLSIFHVLPPSSLTGNFGMWILYDLFAHIQQLLRAFIKLQEATIHICKLSLLIQVFLLGFGCVFVCALTLRPIITYISHHSQSLWSLILDKCARNSSSEMWVIKAVILYALNRLRLIIHHCHICLTLEVPVIIQVI